MRPKLRILVSRMASLGVAASCLAFLPRFAVAQQSVGTVVVHVTSAGLPLAGASVESGTHAARTDSLGTASLTLPAGRRAIVVRQIGFTPVTKRVSVLAGRSVQVTVKMAGAATTLRGIVVSATRDERRISEEPTRIEVTDHDDIDEQLTSSPGDIAELLTEESGVRVQTPSSGLGGGSVRIQGLQGRYTEILSDGLPLFGLSTEGLSPLQIPPMDLQRVEVIKGVSSAMYGPTAMGGVVDLISQRPNNTGRFLLNETSHDGQDAVLWNARQLSPTWGYTLVAGAHHQDAEDLDHDGWFDVPGYRRLVVRPRIFWKGSPGNSLFFTTGFMAESRSGGTLPGSLLPSGQPLVLRMDTRRGDLGGVGRFQLGPGLRLSVRGSMTEQWRTPWYGATRERDRRNTVFSEATLALDRGAHTLVLGADLERDAYTAIDLPALSYTYATPGLFLQDTWSPTSWFGATASARLDANNRYGTFISPRVSVLMRPAGTWNLRISGGSGFFTPTPFTSETEAIGFAHLQSLTGLVAERARGVSADLGTMLGGVEVDASVFATQVDHPVGLRAVPGDSTEVELVNAAQPTRTEGAEIYAHYDHDPVSITAIYQYFQGHQQDVTTGLTTDVPLNPQNALGASVVWDDEDDGGPRIGLEGYYTGRQALAEDPYRTTSHPYFTVDALLEVPVGRVMMFLHGEDITNVRQSQYEPLLRPTPGLGGSWMPEVWAPLAGRVINFGVSTGF